MTSQSNSQSFSNEKIRDFLLGRLRTDQALFEMRLFEDEEFENHVRLEELALADDYARGRLSPADDNIFRTSFLVSRDRQRAVVVSRTLRTKLAPAVAGATPRTRGWLEVNRPIWRYAFAALLLLIVFATVWRRVKEPPQLVRELIPKVLRPKPKPLASQPVEASHPVTTSSPDHAVSEPTSPPHSPTPLVVYLDQNNSINQPAEISVDTAANPLRFQIVVSEEQAETFHVEVLTANGESIFATDATTLNSALSFELPAGLLKSGEYQIRIKAAGKDPAVTYHLLVK